MDIALWLMMRLRLWIMLYTWHDVALEESDNLKPRMPLSDTSTDISLRTGIGPNPSNGVDMQCTVRRTVIPSIQAVSGHLSRRGLDWTKTTKGREA